MVIVVFMTYILAAVKLTPINPANIRIQPVRLRVFTFINRNLSCTHDAGDYNLSLKIDHGSIFRGVASPFGA